MISSDKFNYTIKRDGAEIESNVQDATIGSGITYRSITYEVTYEEFGNTYSIDIDYEYYISNKKIDGGEVDVITLSKELQIMENDISLGIQRWSIENSSNIKIEFKDSYNIGIIKYVQCTIYDADSRVLQNFKRAVSINEISNEEGFNKIINISTDNELDSGKSYRIVARFLDAEENGLASFESELVTNN